MSYNDKTYNYGYCGKQESIRKEARNIYILITSFGLMGLMLHSCKYLNTKLPDDFRAKNTNTLEVKVR